MRAAPLSTYAENAETLEDNRQSIMDPRASIASSAVNGDRVS